MSSRCGQRSTIVLIGLALWTCSRQEPQVDRTGSGSAIAAALVDLSGEPTAPQLEQMLRDRRALRDALTGRPAVRAWMTQKFVGTTGVPVDWDPSAPASGQVAEHMQPAAPGQHAILRVADWVSGLDQLALATFELINMEGASEFAELWKQAVDRTISRRAFGERMTRTEHRAILAFQAFARTQGLEPGPDDPMLRSMLAAPADYPAFHRWILDMRSYDPEEYWGRAFDSIRD